MLFSRTTGCNGSGWCNGCDRGNWGNWYGCHYSSRLDYHRCTGNKCERHQHRNGKQCRVELRHSCRGDGGKWCRWCGRHCCHCSSWNNHYRCTGNKCERYQHRNGQQCCVELRHSCRDNRGDGGKWCNWYGCHCSSWNDYHRCTGNKCERHQHRNGKQCCVELCHSCWGNRGKRGGWCNWCGRHGCYCSSWNNYHRCTGNKCERYQHRNGKQRRVELRHSCRGDGGKWGGWHGCYCSSWLDYHGCTGNKCERYQYWNGKQRCVELCHSCWGNRGNGG